MSEPSFSNNQTSSSEPCLNHQTVLRQYPSPLMPLGRSSNSSLSHLSEPYFHRQKFMWLFVLLFVFWLCVVGCLGGECDITICLTRYEVHYWIFLQIREQGLNRVKSPTLSEPNLSPRLSIRAHLSPFKKEGLPYPSPLSEHRGLNYRSALAEPSNSLSSPREVRICPSLLWRTCFAN